MDNKLLEKRAQNFGRQFARKLFDQRGNHSEMHLSEESLSNIAAAAYEAGAVHESVSPS